MKLTKSGYKTVSTNFRRFSDFMNKPDDIYIETAVPSIYVPSDLNPNINYDDVKKIKNETFSLSARYLPPSEFNYKLPTNNVPEFAFVGRSNVGKSSLISRLLSTQKLVRVSKSPGCTQSVNYYGFTKPKPNINEINQYTLYLVDLPGYGYARSSKLEREKWKLMIEGYLLARTQAVLRRTFILIDGRHGLKDTDREMMNTMDASKTVYQFVVTKADLATKDEIKKTLKSIFEENMKSVKGRKLLPYVHVTSSQNSYGIDALELSMTKIINFDFEIKPSTYEHVSSQLKEEKEKIINKQASEIKKERVIKR